MKGVKRMPNEHKINLPVTVTTGDLEILASGVANISSEKGFQVVIGGIKIEILFQNSEEGQPEIERKPLPDVLTFQYIIKGKIPGSPLSMGLKYPDVIGMTQGIPVHFSFGLSTLGNDQKAITLQYSVYRGTDAVQPSSGKKEGGNE
jgi:hypothetical protein